MSSSRLISVGKIVRTHGVRGAVKISPYGETLASGRAGDRYTLEMTPGAPFRVLTLTSLRAQKNMWLAEFEELSDMEAAQAAVGGEILLPEELLPVPDDDEYYHYQLLGLAVETVSGRPLGVLRQIIETGANDVYAVEREDGGETLIPAIDEVIVRVDLEAGKMIVDPPEGLLDDL